MRDSVRLTTASDLLECNSRVERHFMNADRIRKRKQWFRKHCGLWIRRMLSAPASRKWENVCILYNLWRELQLGNLRWRHLRTLLQRLSDDSVAANSDPPEIQLTR